MTMTHSPDHLAPAGDVIPADEALDRLTQGDLYIFGHGTPLQEWAEAANAEGLYTRHEEIFSTVMPMHTEADSPGTARELDRQILEAWPHQGHRYIVMVGVERLAPEDQPPEPYVQSLLQPRSDAPQGAPLQNTIPSRYVAGYFDVDAGNFVSNPAFTPHYDPALLETTVDTNIVSRRLPSGLEHIVARAPVDTFEEPPQTTPHDKPHEPVDAVW